jgi:hypothetical protein
MNLSSQALDPDGTYRTKVVLPNGTCKFGLPQLQDAEWSIKGEQPAKVPADHSDSGGDGDCVVSIAADRGFRDYHSFWDDDQNKPLRDKNRNPNQLSAQDRVHYSKKHDKKIAKAVDSVWTLVVKKQRSVKLRIILFDRDDKPLANVAWKVTSPVAKNGNTGADGLIQIDNFPARENRGVLTITLPARAKVGAIPANPPGGALAYPAPLVYTDFIDAAPKEPPDRTTAEWQLRIGSLEPFDTPSGVLGRLQNIGFGCAPDSGDREAARAVTRYQWAFLNVNNGSGKPADIQGDLLSKHDNP